MTTATVNLIPVTGRLFIPLTSWAGDASFAATPVANDQIEYPDALTVGADGTVTGPNGTYTLRHVTQLGGIEAVSYLISSGGSEPEPEAPGQVSADLLPPDGLDFISLASGFDNYLVQKWSEQPAVGDQFVFDPADYTLDENLNIETEKVGQLDLWYINAAGMIYALYVDTTGLKPYISGPGQFSELFRSPVSELFQNLFR
ncbi:hypothetical protein [Marinobacter shengliensis]|uniref:hypothetical protein n=1 Tax=Marinobacter shengliensis TaxID=1389223 RepID=UPI001E4B404A|nr:hypothetical protein [Marinobacter shengliensis]MCD1631363.1 hypothetical protein [Marinobacter shengliensis]